MRRPSPPTSRASVLLLASVLGAMPLGCRPEPASLVIVPAVIEVAVGQSASVHVVALDESGARLEASLERPLAIDVAWTSAQPATATVEVAALERAWRPEAVVRGVAPGTTELVARCCGGKLVARTTVKVP